MKRHLKSFADGSKPLPAFFAGVVLFYLAFSPATIEGMGYYGENLAALDQVLTNLMNSARGEKLVPMDWTRHGGLELLFELPFAFFSRLVFGASVKWAGRVLALQPILATALLVTLLLAWAHRLTGDWRKSYALALTAAFATMLWPYSYIGLETTQSLCLLAAAYLALGRTPRRNWPETICLALLCAGALSLKLTGLYLLPALAYLVFCYFQLPNGEKIVSQPKLKLMTVAAIAAIVFAGNYYLKELYWKRHPGGSTTYFFNVLADSPWTVLAQAFSFFGSANKSLLIYAPIVALSLFYLPRAYHHQPRTAVFSVLVLLGLVSGYSLVTVWAEETWGPRYLHAAIAPLVICLAAALSASGESRKQKTLFAAAAVLGLLVSLPGALVAYIGLHSAAARTDRATLVALQYDPALNHPRFNYRLLQIWLAAKFGGAKQPVLWPPPVAWWFERPAGQPPDKTVDLREWAAPQSALLKSWTPALSVPPARYFVLRLCLGIGLFLSLSLFVWQWQWLHRGMNNDFGHET